MTTHLRCLKGVPTTETRHQCHLTIRVPETSIYRTQVYDPVHEVNLQIQDNGVKGVNISPLLILWTEFHNIDPSLFYHTLLRTV